MEPSCMRKLRNLRARFGGSPRPLSRSARGIVGWMGVLVLALSWTSLVGIPAQAGPKGRAANLVYITTNDPTPGQNAVLAFRRNPNDGSLAPLGRFLMRGTGTGN